ncbi:hypothetical protein CTI14_58955, partial [Methylobacterium radiotolerans]
SPETIWVPGHPGWQGQQRATTALTVFGVVFAIVVFAEDAWENTTDFVGDAGHNIGKAWKGLFG